MPSPLSSDAAIWQMFLLTVISLLVGALGGFVGLALGTMRLPAILLLVRDMPAGMAGGTNILVSTLSALTGSYRHMRDRRVDMGAVAAMGIPAVIGAFLGGFFSNLVSGPLLVALVGGFVLWQGVELMARAASSAATSGAPASSKRLALTPGRTALEASIGLGVGLFGGAVGLILGSIRLPALLRILKMDPRSAAGTNLVIGFLMGGFGFLGHGLRGEIDLLLVVSMGAAGMVGTYFGARLTGKVSLKALLLTMGLVLIAVGALLLWDSYSRWQA